MHKIFAMLRGFSFWNKYGCSNISTTTFGDGDYSYGNGFGNGFSNYENFDHGEQVAFGFNCGCEYSCSTGDDAAVDVHLIMDEKDA
jgi:hypothetical protein